jgi:hypothetical protein
MGRSKAHPPNPNFSLFANPSKLVSYPAMLIRYIIRVLGIEIIRLDLEAASCNLPQYNFSISHSLEIFRLD